MKQTVVLVQEMYFDDLQDSIQGAIDDYNDDGYCLVDIQYFNMENEDVECSAFLLFNEVGYGEKVDSRGNKASRCFEGHARC